MKKYILLKILISYSFLIFTIIGFSQTNNTVRKNYNWFDDYIGIDNTGLFNGLRYQETFRVFNDQHKFFLSQNFIIGDILYDGQRYYDIKMKYDLYRDQIIVNLKNHSGDNILQLIPDKIEHFNVHFLDKRHNVKKYYFVKLSDHSIQNSNEFINGNYQILFSNLNFNVYKKNKKVAKKHLVKKHVLYAFISNNQYYCFYQEKYYQINSKNNWINIFPKQKKVIQAFYNKNKALLNSDYDTFLIQLSTRLSNTNASNISLN